jgi:hypothetical protein
MGRRSPLVPRIGPGTVSFRRPVRPAHHLAPSPTRPRSVRPGPARFRPVTDRTRTRTRALVRPVTVSGQNGACSPGRRGHERRTGRETGCKGGRRGRARGWGTNPGRDGPGGRGRRWWRLGLDRRQLAHVNGSSIPAPTVSRLHRTPLSVLDDFGPEDLRHRPVVRDHHLRWLRRRELKGNSCASRP